MLRLPGRPLWAIINPWGAVNGEMRYILVFALALGAAAATVSGGAARIFIDGLFGDWDGVPPVCSDAAGDGSSGDVDFGRLWVANDEDRLYMSLEVGGEINIQGGNRIAVFLDTDNDPATGRPWHGIGAELTWTFGSRTGLFVVDGHTFEIGHDRIGFVAAPTVTAARFEFAFDRTATPVGSYLLFQGDTVRVAIADPDGGDVLPDADGGIVYVFDDAPLPPRMPPSIRKREESHVRFLTYNVLFDGIFETGRRRSFDRIFRALVPDIVGFEEIYNHSAEETRDLVAGFLPGVEWYGAKVDPDIIAVSRYPIVETYAIGTNGAFLIDLGGDDAGRVLLVVAHLPCCGNDGGRQAEVDAVMAFIRGAKAGGGVPDLAPGTPIVIVGDMNFVGDRRQLNTLLTGEIVNTAVYGPWFHPDWDDSDFGDARPLHTDTPMGFTWEDFGSSYWPGRLDFVVYSDAVLDMANAYVLSTREMHEDTLATFGLLETDTATASDHLPVVADFIVSPAKPAPPSRSFVSPNPARRGRTSITFGVGLRGRSKQVTYYDVMGRRVNQAAAGPDDDLILWDGRNSDGDVVAPGIYIAVVTDGSVTETLKIVYLR